MKTPEFKSSKLYFFTSAICLLLLTLADIASGSYNTPQGFVYCIYISSRKFRFAGWAGGPEGDRLKTVENHLGEKRVLHVEVDPFERPDVPAATGRMDWLKVGWQVDGKLPKSIRPGNYMVRAKAMFQSGLEIDLNTVTTVTIGSGAIAKENLKTIVLILFIIVPIFSAACVLSSDRFSDWMNEKFGIYVKPEYSAICVISLVFIALVSIGVTGSSLPIGVQKYEG